MGKKMGYTSPIAIHPGEVVKDTIEMLGMSQADLSVRTGLSEKTISLILNGKEPVTVDTALKLERVLDIDQKLLVNMQARYWSDQSRLEEKERLEAETSQLSNYSCYKELALMGYVENTRDPIKKVEELLRFFNVNSLSFVPNVMQVSFKRSVNGNIDNYALASWLRAGELEAHKKDLKPFDKEILKRNVEKMRELTKEKPEIFSNQLVELCAEAGVKLVFVKHLSRTKVNGATYWLTKDNPVIQISLFNKYADIFWFTLFHEIGHILKHGKKEEFIDFENGYSASDPKEKEADEYAQKVIYRSEEEYQKFKQGLTKVNLKTEIKKYSGYLGVDPGIVAGRIGREFNAWPLVSSLRMKLTFSN